MTQPSATQPQRPIDVPEPAQYLSWDETLARFRDHSGRGYLRVSFPFVVWNFHGVMLRGMNDTGYVGVNKKTWAMGKALIFNGKGERPHFWVWTLAESRAGR